MRRFYQAILAAAAATTFAAATAEAVPTPREKAGETPRAAHAQTVQFPVWGGFGDSPRGRPFVAGRPYGSSWWSPQNDYYTGRRSYYRRHYYDGHYGPSYYGSRYYSRRHLRRGWR